MEDLYAILKCSSDAPAEEIRRQYRILAKIHHPDSQSNENQSDHSLSFIKVNNAYKVLSDVQLRKEYDTRWHQLVLLQELPVHETVEFDELEVVEDCEEMRTHPCRCGDNFIISQLDILLRFQYASCQSCSLCIQILYPSTETVGDDDLLRPICDKTTDFDNI